MIRVCVKIMNPVEERRRREAQGFGDCFRKTTPSFLVVATTPEHVGIHTLIENLHRRTVFKLKILYAFGV